MKKLLSSLKLNSENFLQHSDLINFRGGCNLQLCLNCCNTATGGGGHPNGNYGACGNNCSVNHDPSTQAWRDCFSTCSQNICNQCFQYYSSVGYGCYC